ncbi:putative G2/M phase-specific E3 ubiquitin-protein ligase-like [Scophthalmus maximus]|uniref:Putative G2/M phase-specific E3 ubiquitin-protein ligase-like n=1 Tax=Scophthalmus maximus TaxID=52904 RepID=A0A2U9CB81_SCOMX|nr:putative G2/M phase-specific E3 ubiquitin-protein ligase-like [Scophthalmus maximus]
MDRQSKGPHHTLNFIVQHLDLSYEPSAEPKLLHDFPKEVVLNAVKELLEKKLEGASISLMFWNADLTSAPCTLASNRTAKMIKQFTDGMNAFGNLWDLEPLSKPAFKAIFNYNYSQRGTNQREEDDTIFSWEMVLNMIEDKLTDLKFEDLLIFFTGADEVL